MEKIKIVFILGTLEIGGTERQFIEIVRGIDRTRFKLRVLAFSAGGPLKQEIEALHIPLTCLGFVIPKGRAHPESYWRLYLLVRNMLRYFRQERPHIVQSFLFWPNILGCLSARYARVPVIMTGRRELMAAKYRKFPNQWLQALTNRWSTAIIANSSAVRNECLHQERGISPQKIRVIYNGIDFNRYGGDFDKIAIRCSFQIPPEAVTVGIVANLRPCKGHQDFLQAAAHVARIYPQARFLLIGEDRGIQRDLEALASALSIGDMVIFTGQRDDIPELLAILDVQVSSSTTESLSNAILEGMAAGNPIVATHVGGSAELIEHEKTGLLVPPEQPDQLAQAIIRLLQNEPLRLSLGEAAQKRAASRFQRETVITLFESLYQNLVSPE